MKLNTIYLLGATTLVLNIAKLNQTKIHNKALEVGCVAFMFILLVLFIARLIQIKKEY